MLPYQQLLRFLLRLIGTSSLFALIFVAAPYSWMNSIHQSLALGDLASQPIVGYLARSTSALYAFVGGLLWVCSFDISRYHSLLRYLGFAFVTFGVTLFIIDTVEGLPLFWRYWEGPVVVMLGSAILFLNSQVRQSEKTE